MKSPLLLSVLALTPVPLLFVAVRSISPRASVAQTTQVQPAPGSGQSAPSIGFETPDSKAGWGTIDEVKAMRNFIPYDDDGGLWAIQKVPVDMKPQRFKATFYPGSFFNSEGTKFTFQSTFSDGSPCGTWNVVQPKSVDEGEVLATFYPPERAGLGYLWVDVLNRAGKKIGGYKKTPFAVLPLAIKCSTTQWKPTGRSDEWSREVHVFAGPKVPYKWRYPPGKPVARLTGAFAKLISSFGFDVKGMDDIPLRLSLAPAVYVRPNEMPASRLSVSHGVTQMVPGADKQMLTSYTTPDPRVVTIQTTRWKLGNSNQIDAAQVVAQLDVAAAIPKAQQGGAR